MFKFNRPIQFLFLIFTLSLVSHLAIAQSKTEKDDKDKNQVSLEGITEAILIDGQPALKIIGGNSNSTTIRLQKRDNENALVFSVTRVTRFGFGYKLGDEGNLIITKTRVNYTPNFEKKQFFNVLSSDIQNITIGQAGLSGILALNFEVKGDKKKFVCTGLELFNRKDFKPSLEFLSQALKDFDSTFAEFNRLTASVLQNDEDEEEVEEEETETDITDKYDRFKDLTIISTSKMLVRGNKRSIRTYADYNFAGKTQTKPENVSLYFSASAARPIFREDNLELNFLVDGKRISLGEMKLADEEKTKTRTKQTVTVTMSYETFEQIAKGAKVEFQIGDLEYKLTDVQLEAFRKLLSYKIEE